MMIDQKEPNFWRPAVLLSYAQRHDGVDYVIAILFQSFYGFLPGYRGLGHDEFDVLSFEAAVVNLFIIVVLFIGLLILDCLALAVFMRVVVARMIGICGFGGGKLLRSSGLGLRVEILNLGFTEDAKVRSGDGPQDVV
jgi:hypothetical protein